ncbi:hypothetical protein EX30DRAFT_183259 [Ascodesmis nigricans]|uniref:protein kinase C n=1 Tax=Ascodesmis nigricans TaxID=341454 RepID=A0A4S2MZW2_9PEZI|nr:hypothetical protein EX30DRAFT_183259 [Ascodesmis nigricans]
MSEKLLQDVSYKIKREETLINGARAMRQSTDNVAVQTRLDSQIRESQRNLGYLKERQRELEERIRQTEQEPQPRQRPNYSKLDLIKYDTPHLGPRIQLMLSQLEFKLSVEKQYKEGIEKMIKLYQIEGDRKSYRDAENKRTESNQKIQLLKQALKRHEDLHVDMDFGDNGDDASTTAPTSRKPLTGRLQIRVHAVQDVDHATTSRFARGPETFVIIKVEDQVRVRTKTTRNDKWLDEHHEIDVDKANEIEITVYDKPGENPLPIGMLWVRINDLIDELRRKKVEQELAGSGWVRAGQLNSGSSQPVGQIHLSMNFTKFNRNKRPLDLGLGRKGAVRARKDEVHEMYGHKFVEQQFYNIMRCALCSELLKYSAGMQCADCKYTCHRKCYQKVVTKCITKPNNEWGPDEEKIKHRIPHRFEPITNVGAKWCCHCGYMLPLGKKNAKSCTECDLSCHAQCQHLVPDFCGMPMEAARQIRETLQNKPGVQATPKAVKKTPVPQSPVSQGPPSDASYGSDASQRTSIQSDQHIGHQSRPSYSGPSSPPPTQPHPTAQHAADAAYGLAPQSPTYPPSNYPPYQPSDAAVQGATAAYQSGRMSTGSQPGYQPPGQTSRVPVPNVPYTPGQPSGPVKGQPAARPDPYSAQQNQIYQPQQHIPPQVQHQQLHQYAYGQPPPPQPGHQGHTSRPSTGGAVAPYHAGPPSHPAPQKPQQRPQKIGLDHFNFLAVLGKGNFGKVMLAETKATKQLYAIKVLKKEFIIENDEVESTKSEKRVFLIANRERHPFLLNLHACFQTETRVYFVMEYISGGDLMLHIQRGQFGSKRAQFYAAEVCLALKYFHENGVIYRDLKLDNILLTLDGHIKIADYGLCKEDMWYGSTTSTFCGTPEFMAPEILMDKRYGRAVDWWAFGVLIYQMLLQQSPFRGEDEDEIYDAILSDEPLYPIHMPRDSVSILQKVG